MLPNHPQLTPTPPPPAETFSREGGIILPTWYTYCRSLVSDGIPERYVRVKCLRFDVSGQPFNETFHYVVSNTCPKMFTNVSPANRITIFISSCVTRKLLRRHVIVALLTKFSRIFIIANRSVRE